MFQCLSSSIEWWHKREKSIWFEYTPLHNKCMNQLCYPWTPCIHWLQKIIRQSGQHQSNCFFSRGTTIVTNWETIAVFLTVGLWAASVHLMHKEKPPQESTCISPQKNMYRCLHRWAWRGWGREAEKNVGSCAKEEAWIMTTTLFSVLHYLIYTLCVKSWTECWRKVNRVKMTATESDILHTSCG